MTSRFSWPAAEPAKVGAARFLAIAMCLCPAGLGRAVEPPGTAASANTFHLGISPETWTGVKREDAAAAITSWARIIALQQTLATEPRISLFGSFAELHLALRDGQLDAAAVLTEQCLALEPSLRPDEVFVTVRGGSFTERYLVLVQRNGSIEKVADLRGRHLILQSSSRTSLASAWLDTLLAPASSATKPLPPPLITRIEKPSQPILQVFFHRADACLVTSNAFQVASELNPQLRRSLRVLAVSPPFVPSLFFFHPGHTSPHQATWEAAILELNRTPTGRQVLTVFQADKMEKRPFSCLDSARQVLAQRDRATQGSTGIPPSPEPPSP